MSEQMLANRRAFHDAYQSRSTVSVSDELREWLSRPKGSYVANRFCNEGTEFSDKNPASDETLARIFAAPQSLVEEAVQCARRQVELGAWAQLDLKQRAAKVRAIGDLILENRATLAILESLDTGKPISESYEGDIPRAASNFHFFADFVLNEGELAFQSNGYWHLGMREPVGVVALITPWNLPLYLETWKVAPALLMGNSVILKPSELTPLTAQYLSELIHSLELPLGTYQCLQGFGERAAGEWLVESPDIDAISFTGETQTGRAIMARAANGPTKVSFELGGKGASVLFKDCDLEKTLGSCLSAAFRNQGEICLATPRFYIEDGIYDEFVEKFTARARALRIGDPLDFNTQMGSLISQEHREKVEAFVSDVDRAKILCGGKRPELDARLARGAFFEPTVLVGLSDDHPITQNEVFGPVISIYRFSNEDEVVHRVNGTRYGLSASIYSRDLERAIRVGRRLRKGLVWVNGWFIRDLRVPFGGQKASGIGREGGKFSLDFFSEWKSLCLPM